MVVEAIFIEDIENVTGSLYQHSPIIQLVSLNGVDDEIQGEKESSAEQILNSENAEERVEENN